MLLASTPLYPGVLVFIKLCAKGSLFTRVVLPIICLTQAFWKTGPRVLPAACQPSLKRGSGGFTPGSRREFKGPLALPHSGTREADTPYPRGGYSLLGCRIPLTRLMNTPYSKGGYSLLGRRVLLTRKLLARREGGTPFFLSPGETPRTPS